MTEQDLALCGPIVLPALAALLLILVDLVPGARGARGSGGSFLLAALGALVSLAFTGFALVDGKEGPAFYNTLRVDRLALVTTLVVHFATFVAIVLSRTYLRRRDGAQRVDEPEYHAFLLASASGMALLAAANDLVNVFLGIEILSIPLYLLACTHRRERRSIEAGFKYLLLGAFASAFLLFGAALLFGASGTTTISAMPAELVRVGAPAGLAALGAVMLLVGVLFKLAAAPFHAWSPDVYEGSPLPVTAFMAVATKAAAFAALLRLAPAISTALGADRAAQLVGVIAVLSMLVGNFGALRQQNLKRLLAYSSIAHAGYMLVGVAAVLAAAGGTAAESGTAAVLYYLVAYAAMNLGAFAVANVLERGENREDVDELVGLGRDRPLLALSMAVFSLALAGVPPAAGFFGKLYVFSAAVESGLIVLAVVGVLASVVGLYYYLRLLILMYAKTPDEGALPAPAPDGLMAAAAIFTVVLTLWMGVMPARFVDFVTAAARAF